MAFHKAQFKLSYLDILQVLHTLKIEITCFASFCIATLTSRYCTSTIVSLSIDNSVVCHSELTNIGCCCKVGSLPGSGSPVLDQYRQCTDQQTMGTTTRNGTCTMHRSLPMNAKSRLHTRLAQCKSDLVWYYFGCTSLIVHTCFMKFKVTWLREMLVHAQNRQSTSNYISKTQGTHLAHADELKGLHGKNLRIKNSKRQCFVEVDR